ncbi:nucleotide sugar dehydrogenase [Mesorhizobium sp.]|uniref:nucleotide sugar dehydrogenase n=1 Tax=Mesorhizobium sp. TaxID=1871066 RepID=UPI000FE41AE3|nr:nucleotide sugar dehydrogenase [Mesorhizobium sp.]RWN55622.1 MAG: nucleotide sugar dehydrogenase [Mesorhizobium sp.]RWN77227.1 MAG: nucleotide sugar dehydrogenase [Mesorhizobium sp.]RWN80234.1 MAG: nucleotide sugar dehydrogenase [Mesorhizobium sp.]RWN86147.1 MAG: nucleotide sugar dehydrogenase [Mesorhizobium sp.]RWO14963.1 MAG: nucleotide sugar dehydrogenase [Mesorhizobium sp.]
MNLDDLKIAVIGLGYVGLPLAMEFGKRRAVLGFDIRESRIDALARNEDSTLEVDAAAFSEARHISFSSCVDDLRGCGIFIVTVPTPIDRANRPDLAPLIRACHTVGSALSKGAVVIFESTVYPGCTREVCMPILEATSGLKFNEDFFLGYSPERANPGDREHRLTTITKVTSGSTAEVADAIDALYASIVPKGTHKASSIEVAEAAKVIENTQRDLNIALMNELSIIFHRLGIDTLEVLAAAQTKWNFLPFRPGLVGGHCIGVDPYYLTHRAQETGYHPEVILAGRRINDRMGEVVAERVSLLMMKRGFPVVGGRVLVLGIAFKENCPDLRNTKVVDTISALSEMNARIDVWDPWVSRQDCIHEYGIEPLAGLPEPGSYDALIVAVGHREFGEFGTAGIRAFGKPNAVLYDVKGIFPHAETDGRL